ncbi:ligand-binding sensor domain-containing protein [Lacinutrix jangbogonensis]|uniref:ligand-binding sensor domain-containing protein n=1 Tax=Lacinutrix jangbogonensis TaxID=1469557 RepID=UPI00053E29F3|nr:LytTR family DNA-binding domain-containing protein [Lacinutrix jangbogonensis]
MNGTLKYCLLTIFKLLFIQVALGQEPVYKNLTMADGLPSMQVYDTYQDVNGYLWFATDAGISKYNGKEFENFKIEDGITSNTVFKFFPQKNGDIWCTTYNSTLFYFNPKDYIFKKPLFQLNIPGNFINFPPEDLLVLDDNTIYLSYSNAVGKVKITKDTTIVSNTSKEVKNYSKSLIIEKIEGIFFGFIGKTLDSQKSTKNDKFVSSSPYTNFQYSHIQQHGKYSMFSTARGVYIKIGDELICAVEEGKQPLNFGVLDDNLFWVAYELGGFGIYNFDGTLKKRYLQSVSGTHIFKDDRNGLWFSTLTDGVFYTSNINLVEVDDFNGDRVHKLSVSKKDDLYVSLENKSLLKIKNGKICLIIKNSGTYLRPISYYDIIPEITWVSHHTFDLYGHHLKYLSGTPFNSETEEFFIDPLLSSEIIITSLVVSKILKREESYLLGTKLGAFKLFDNSELIKIEDEKLKYRIDDIEGINAFEFYATHGNGVQIFKSGHFVQEITTSNGLPSNIINELVVKNDSSIFMCSKKGLSEAVFKEGKWHFSSNRLLGYDVSDVEFIGDSIWVGTNSGLLKTPYNIPNKPSPKLNLHLQIKDITVNDTPTLIDGLTSLNFNENNLRINYDAIYFKDNTKLNFRHKLTSEAAWSYTKNRSLTYTHIEPGSYELKIQASIDDIHWDEGLDVRFVILPPFYLTMSFVITISLFLLLIIYLIFKYRILLYNKMVFDKVIKIIARKLKADENYIVIKEQGKEIKIRSHHIFYVKSSKNYCEIHLKDKKHVVRSKLSEIFNELPDKSNYLKIHRSYFVRIDKITEKTKNTVLIKDKELKVSITYLTHLRELKL